MTLAAVIAAIVVPTYGMLMLVQLVVRQSYRDLMLHPPPKPRWWQYFKLWDPPA